MAARARPIAGLGSTNQAITEGDHLATAFLPFRDTAARCQP